MSKKYRISEFAERIGKSTATVRRWEVEGKIKPKRHPSGQRYFDESDVQAMLGHPPPKRVTLVYCRVSSAAQKDDLALQCEAMEIYCRAAGITVDEWIKEIGGGMNFKRKQFLAILERILRGEVAKLIVAHKDRLMRFGFDLFQHLATEYGCSVEVVNQESLSPPQEMVEDLISIVHTFSCRLYGMRKYKSQIKHDFPDYNVGKLEYFE